MAVRTRRSAARRRTVPSGLTVPSRSPVGKRLTVCSGRRAGTILRLGLLTIGRGRRIAVAALRPCKRLTIRGGRRLATIRSSTIGLDEGVRTGFRLLTIRSPTLVVCGASARLSVRSRLLPIRRRLVSIRLGAALRPGKRLAVRGSRRTTMRSPACPYGAAGAPVGTPAPCPGRGTTGTGGKACVGCGSGAPSAPAALFGSPYGVCGAPSGYVLLICPPLAESPVDRVKSLLPQPATCNAVCT